MATVHLVVNMALHYSIGCVCAYTDARCVLCYVVPYRVAVLEAIESPSHRKNKCREPTNRAEVTHAVTKPSSFSPASISETRWQLCGPNHALGHNMPRYPTKSRTRLQQRSPSHGHLPCRVALAKLDIQARSHPPYLAPIKFLGKKAQTVPTTDRAKEITITVVAKTLSLAEISSRKSLR